jgi:hypothetical protein
VVTPINDIAYAVAYSVPGDGPHGPFGVLDALTFDIAVPEPATAGAELAAAVPELAAAGAAAAMLAALGTIRRRRHRRSQ